MDKLEELLDFLDELKNYREVATFTDSKLPEYKREYKKLLEDKNWADYLKNDSLRKDYSSKIREEELKEELREKLVRKSGALSGKIIELTGKQYFTQAMTKYDMWVAAFNPLINRQETALAFCIDAVNEAIGKLKAEGESWGAEKVRTAKTRKEPPKVFIAHEGMTRALDKVKSFLDVLGIKYLIAEIEPSDGRQIEGQVTSTYGEADFAIVLATKGKVVDKETGKSYMGMNVADELGRAREVFKNRIILLLQKGVEPHTNISGIVYEPFTTQYMENVFKKIVKEIRNWGLI